MKKATKSLLLAGMIAGALSMGMVGTASAGDSHGVVHVFVDSVYDAHGYNSHGYNVHGYNNHGYNVHGYNVHGYNTHGYNAHGYYNGHYNSH